MRKTQIKHVLPCGDGRKIGSFMASFYLNSYIDRRPFHAAFSEYEPAVLHRFTLLYADWLKRLAGYGCYDDRNQASAEMARACCYSLGDLDRYEIPKRMPKALCGQYELENPHDSGQIAAMMRDFLCSVERYDDFVAHMVQDAHRTIQQTFTDFGRDWCQYLLENPSRAKAKTLRMATVISGHARYLPHI
jgi:hypothetical protein